jgi:hypothetical protein
MAHISVDVDVDLDDFDLDDVLDNIDSRYKYDKDQRRDIDDWLNSFNKVSFKTTSLLDEMKIDFLRNNLDKITLNDLENLI